MQQTHRHTHTHAQCKHKQICAQKQPPAPLTTPRYGKKDTTFPVMWIKRLIGSNKSTLEHSRVRLKMSIYL